MKKKLCFVFAVAFMLCSISHAQETVYLRNGSVVRGVVTEIPGKDNVQVKSSDGSVFIFETGEILNIVKEKCDFSETVRLKNGSVIHGCVSERKPGVSLTLQTKDGSLLKYSMDEVADVEKSVAGNYSPAYIVKSDKSIKRGYRGFVNFSYNENFNGYRGGEFNTVHGYQGNPYLFIGVGLGLNFDYCAGYYDYYTTFINYYHHYVEWAEDFIISIPVYLNVRTDIPLEHGGPFFDYKLGVDAFSVGSVSDLYEFIHAHSILSVGYRVKFRGKGGVNFSLGWKHDRPLSSWKTYSSNSLRLGIGFDF
ncbi:MAG: hypothetical protein SPL42_02100 [Bacteroidales bacterium]|nr:hypothetical protein [Bacteroidales bacterium]MDY6347214.1 hypothetical protein [Bacteroidales bacterium]